MDNEEKKYVDPIHPDPDDPTTPTEPTDPDLPTRYTPNYKLPLWDKDSLTSWLSTMNYAMTTIDFALHKLALITPLDGKVPPELVDSVTKLEDWQEQASEQLSTIELNLIALQKAVSANTESLKQLTIKVDTNTRDIEEIKNSSSNTSEEKGDTTSNEGV